MIGLNKFGTFTKGEEGVIVGGNPLGKAIFNQAAVMASKASDFFLNLYSVMPLAQTRHCLLFFFLSLLEIKGQSKLLRALEISLIIFFYSECGGAWVFSTWIIGI